MTAQSFELCPHCQKKYAPIKAIRLNSFGEVNGNWLVWLCCFNCFELIYLTRFEAIPIKKP